MSNPAAPKPDHDPFPGRDTAETVPAPDPDIPNPFGPDAMNVRDDDPPGGQAAPEAPPPGPPSVALDDDDFAPDET
ncbi:hypothetical protein OJF2_75170 [Aquisphaera giovannonii]|uniref:Uncharacterized protein n=1 Tax=Aquisphaera giovannonii TaxID=406548 RepID=A0A5B9WEE2_9BACT|nr:hypothetical protein [Aquisphaera giovannonii]QEH38907.1 hypothetical protein OJF2_75170 [Aquisphaera giovannonii]